MFSRLQKTGLIFIVLGVISLGLEKVLYDTIDSNGVLQESFFLPLGTLLLFVGILLFVVGFFLKWMRHR